MEMELGRVPKILADDSYSKLLTTTLECGSKPTNVTCSSYFRRDPLSIKI